jgi:hypothetical protein
MPLVAGPRSKSAVKNHPRVRVSPSAVAVTSALRPAFLGDEAMAEARGAGPSVEPERRFGWDHPGQFGQPEQCLFTTLPRLLP